MPLDTCITSYCVCISEDSIGDNAVHKEVTHTACARMGEIVIWKLEESRILYLMITKKNIGQINDVKALTWCLRTVKYDMEKRKLSKLALLNTDELSDEWDVMKGLICAIFERTDIHIVAYSRIGEKWPAVVACSPYFSQIAISYHGDVAESEH